MDMHVGKERKREREFGAGKVLREMVLVTDGSATDV